MITNREKVQRTLDALVNEAYTIALDRGLAITNPDAWRAWKRDVYTTTAKREGAGYLRKHHQRLGLGTTTTPRIVCAKCNGNVVTLTNRDDDPNTPYCSYKCAGIATMSLAEWLETATPEQRANMARLRPRQEGAA